VKTKTKKGALRAPSKPPEPSVPVFSLKLADVEQTAFVSVRLPKPLVASLDCVAKVQASDRTKVLIAVLTQCVADGLLPRVPVAPDPGQVEMALK